MKIFDKNLIISGIYSVAFFTSKDKVVSPICYNPELNHNELVFRITGKTINRFLGQVLEVKPNTVVMMPKGNLGTYQVNTIERGKCIDIFFDTEQPLCDKVYTFDCSKKQKFVELFEKCFSVWEQKQDGYYHKCLSIVYDILSKLYTDNNEYVDQRKIDKIKAGQEYLLSHFCDIEFNYYYPAKLSKISYTYFKKIFKSLYGMPPIEYVFKLRMEKASDLLRTGILSVEDTALACGYVDVCYFSKSFKKYHGISPKYYIANIRK